MERDQGRVNPALANDPDGRHPDSHPMRRGRIRPRFRQVLELASVKGPIGEVKITDRDLFNGMSRMDWERG